MSTQPHACAFLTLYPRDGHGWPRVIVPILNWLVNSERELLPEYRMALLLETHTLDLTQADRSIVVTHCPLDDAGEVGEWAVRYIAPDAAQPARRWQTDIGLARDGDAWHVSALMSYGLAPGYVGSDPPRPAAVAPPAIGKMVASKEWTLAKIGAYAPANTPYRLQVAKGNRLVQAIADPTRTQPIVYVSLASTGKALCDPAALARVLAGAAVVVVAESPDLDVELDWLLLEDFRCFGGAVRVYLPNARLEDERDSLRHRSLEPEELENMRLADILQTIARGVLSWNLALGRERQLTIDDVQLHALERRLATIRTSSERDGNDMREYLALLEKENAHLRMQLRGLTAQAQQAANAETESNATIGRLTRELVQLRSEGDRRASSTNQEPRRESDLRILRELPNDLPAALDTIGRLFPNRVRVTERARRSAQAATMNKPREIRNAWRVLHALATTLYDLIFADVAMGDVQTRFRNLTGIEFGITEGQQTKRDDRLMLLRKDVDDQGNEIDITPHLKYGDHPPRLLRVHFAIDRERRLLIIGHAGDHLDTFGTQRLK